MGGYCSHSSCQGAGFYTRSQPYPLAGLQQFQLHTQPDSRLFVLWTGDGLPLPGKAVDGCDNVLHIIFGILS